MLILVHKGKTKRLISGFTCAFFSIVFIVTGKLPTEDLEKNATDKADHKISCDIEFVDALLPADEDPFFNKGSEMQVIF